ncbi:anthranilate synthase component I family protein [Croceitalea rosinachiae]|uniref:Anthranilate synthase component I family protein n=1 Tax=Croceitalea rosinachiae TaxID=3075596 RepID=A0ABU3AC49_9FLAO|nr:anthranilate synthase component I family protein [Croceitalea sp. F388]MDT0607752.1 anthranilate synthase component I family protein [Croceitalea sp. F388]
MRKSHFFKIDNPNQFRKQLLRWAQQFDELVFLDSNHHKHKYNAFDIALAVGSKSHIKTNSSTAFQMLSDYKSKTKDWIFGYLSYDLKNELEQLSSDNYDGLDFYSLHFFQPKKLLFLKGNRVEFQYLEKYTHEIKTDLEDIHKINLNRGMKKHFETPKIKLRIHKDAYLSKIKSVLEKIQLGDIYEVNICQEFFALNTEIDPLTTFEKLNTISESPFAVYLKLDENFALSASPERYLKRIEKKIISQPIKGTAARSQNFDEDQFLKTVLEKDPKELSENIMITDLVRNDLSKNALKGSVKVEELCKVYSYKQVHQMISTISAAVEDNVDSVQLLKNTFPMGSMTGAPKIAAMQIIEALEETKRGLYSGAVGYFDPDDNFDFNVMIRSILYNSKKKYVSFSVGSAITAKSIPQKEYEECLLKAKAMRKALEQK